ncbi:MAG: SLC13 family permease [Alphaproteobacteria bacterium]|nr:SLC13 family permease [Alphaproteobacteria bacterium]
MHDDVPLAVTTLFGLLLAALIVSLALEEKLHAKKSVIVGFYAVVILLLAAAFGLARRETVEILGHHITFPVYIPGVDWEVVAIILGSAIFVDVTSKSGLFTWIAIKLTKISKGDPVRLLSYYGVMTVVFSAVLNNVTAMIIIGTLTTVSVTKLNRSSLLLGFLLIEALLTNVGGLLTLISSVPNIIIGNAAGIPFVEFFVKASPYVVVATALTIWLGARMFKIRPLADDAERAQAAELVAAFDENDGIASRGFFWFGAFMTLAFIVAMASASFTPYIKELGLGYIAIAFAVIMLLRYKATADRFYQDVDWDLIGFFIGLFIIVNMMELAQVLTVIGAALEPVLALGERTGPAVLLFASAATSSVTDNIPLAAVLAKILVGLNVPGDSPFWWAVIFGANLGGNITPIGSASTLVAVAIIHKAKLPLSFGGFVKMAVPFAVGQLALAAIYVLFVLG